MKKLSVECLSALQQACEQTSQNKVAKKLGVSPAMISQALKGVYEGNIRALEARIEGVLLERLVECPLLGELNRSKCLELQSDLESPTTNHIKIRLRDYCPDCQHSLKAEV